MVHTRAWPRISPSTKIYFRCHFRGFFVNVRANCASIIVFQTFACRMHWLTYCNKACISTPDCRGHSRPPFAYREFAVDHGTCYAFLYACTQMFCRPSKSLCDLSMKAAENWKVLADSFLCEEFGRKFWHQRVTFSDLVPTCFPIRWQSAGGASDPFQLRPREFFDVDLHATPCYELQHRV